jgi:molybdopterin converting factor small subunit
VASLTVRLYASLRDAAGTARIEARGATLADVLDDLGRKGGPALRAALYDPSGTVRPGIQILLGGTDLEVLKLAGVTIADGETLHVMPLMAGG